MRSIEPIDKAYKKYITFEKLDDYFPGIVKVEDIFYVHGKYNVVITFYAPTIMFTKNFVNEF